MTPHMLIILETILKECVNMADKNDAPNLAVGPVKNESAQPSKDT